MYSYVSECHSFVPVCYSCVTRVLLVCYSYVARIYPYVTNNTRVLF